MSVEEAASLVSSGDRIFIGGGGSTPAALVNAVCDLLSAQGYCACYACVSHPHPESEAFFAALGFAEQARLPAAGFKLGLWLDLSICERPLRARTARPVPPMAVGALDGAYVRGVFARCAKDIR